MDVCLKELPDVLDISRDFFGEEVRLLMSFCLAAVELDDIGIVEVADFFEGCLKDVPFDVFVDLGEAVQSLDDR